MEWTISLLLLLLAISSSYSSSPSSLLLSSSLPNNNNNNNGTIHVVVNQRHLRLQLFINLSVRLRQYNTHALHFVKPILISVKIKFDLKSSTINTELFTFDLQLLLGFGCLMSHHHCHHLDHCHHHYDFSKFTHTIHIVHVLWRNKIWMIMKTVQVPANRTVMNCLKDNSSNTRSLQLPTSLPQPLPFRLDPEACDGRMGRNTLCLGLTVHTGRSPRRHGPSGLQTDTPPVHKGSACTGPHHPARTSLQGKVTSLWFRRFERLQFLG